MVKARGLGRRRVTRRALIKAGAGGVAGALVGSHSLGTVLAKAPSPSAATSQPGALDVTTAPILVVVGSAAGNPFTGYLDEILRAEGVRDYEVLALGNVNAGSLTGRRVVILGECSPSSAQISDLQNFVNAGGGLVAMKPVAGLASLLRISSQSGTYDDDYFRITDGTLGAGLYSNTLQFHGSANRYSLNGAAQVAQVYSDRTAATSHVAASIATVGAGQAAMFAFDVARSIVLMRQGNPANANVDVDGDGVVRTVDLYNGWVDLERSEVPQADMLQRLLVRVIEAVCVQPTPRLWYFPSTRRAVMVPTADAHANPQSYYQAMVNEFQPRGIGLTFYMTTAGLPNSTVQSWRSQGFDFATHPYVDGGFSSGFAASLADFEHDYGFTPRTSRTHQVRWTGWDQAASIASQSAVELDFNMYQWGAWLNKPGSVYYGYITGSGQPMRFASASGAVLPIYQQHTTLVDETLCSGLGTAGLNYATSVAISRRTIDDSVDGYHTAMATQFHVDYFAWGGVNPWVLETIDYALQRGVQILHADAWLTFIKQRAASNVSGSVWSNGVLSFTLSSGGGQQTVLLPLQFRGAGLSQVRINGSNVSYNTMAINGINYAAVAASNGSWQATYSGDSTPPQITGVNVTNIGPNSARVVWTTDESSTSVVDYGVGGALNLQVNAPGMATSHTVDLTGLTPSTQYSYRVTSADGFGNSTSSAVATFSSTSSAAVALTSVSPTSASNEAQRTLTLTGANFVNGATVRLGTTSLGTAQFIGSTSLQASVPAGFAPGTYDVTVTNPDTSLATLTNGYTVLAPPPVLSGASPAVVSAGAQFSLTGTGFASGATVRLDSTVIASSVQSATLATAIVPAGTGAGAYDVSITNPNGQSSTLPNALTVTALLSVSHTTLGDFNAGTFTSTQALSGGSAGDGAVLLTSTGFSDGFDGTALNAANWASGLWDASGSVVVSGGTCAIRGAWIRGLTNVTDGAVTARLTFPNSAWQNFGLSRQDNLDVPWLLFGVPGWDTSRVYARINAGSTNVDVPLTGLTGAPHDFTVEYHGTQVRFLVDGSLVHEATISNSGVLVPWLSVGVVGAPLNAESAAVASYAASGMFLSGAFDTGQNSDWAQISMAAEIPSGTTARIRARSSTGGLQFSTWSAWSSASPFDLSVPDGQFLQYELEFTTSNAALTPSVGSVTATYQGSAGPPVATVTVNPSSASVGAGGTQQFAATMLDAQGQPVLGASANWSVVNGGGTIDQGGLFTAGTTPGSFPNTIRATSQGVTGSASVTVTQSSPSVSSVTPSSGPTTSETLVTIGGSDFQSGATARLGSTALTNVQYIGSTSLQATVPPGLASGAYDLTVTNPDGGTGTRQNAFTAVAPAPALGSVSPSTVNAGDAFTLSGSEFVSGAVVRLGAIVVPSNVDSAASASATVPAGTQPGTYDVSITNPDGQSALLPNALTVTTLLTIGHTTLADFNAGTFTATQAFAGGAAGDGAIALASTGFSEAFDGSTLDAAIWATGLYEAGGSVSMSGGACSVSGAWIRGHTTITTGVFSARMTFASSAWQNAGLSRSDALEDPWLLFGVPGWDTSRVYARINVGSTNAEIPLTGLIGAPHDFAIEYRATQVRFLVDGVLVHEATIPNAGALAPWFSVAATGAQLVVESATLASYAASGTFLGAPLDAGAHSSWMQLMSQRSVPTGTTIRSRARTSPDGSAYSAWSAWNSATPVNLSLPEGRFLQYEVELTTSDAAATPVVGSVSATYRAGSTPSVATVDVTPASAMVPTSGTQQFSATLLDGQGQPVPGATATWAVVNGGGTINGSGLFTAGPTAGTFANTVVATSQGVSGSASVTVSALAPTITSVTPGSGPAAGGTTVAIAGTNFQTGATVRFGANLATNVSVAPTSISATSPAGSAGAVDVVVTNPDSGSATRAGGFQYVAAPSAPAVTSVTPASGPTTGGNTVTIAGSSFTGTTQVRFGTTNAPGFTVVSDTQISVAAPARSAGATNVLVTTAAGTSPASAPSAYTYVPAPTISSVSPSSGPPAGGTSVNVNGSNFQQGATVRFGSNPATVVSTTATQITVTAPAGAAGSVNVVVTNPDTGTATRTNGYQYVVPPPAITSVAPTSGPLSGGTTVVVTGTNFTGATQVRFGATNAPTYTVDADTQITVVAPARSAGTISVRVTTPSGISPTGSQTNYTYIAAPRVDSVSPTSGPVAGGTSVVITGVRFNGATVVTFGTVPAASFTVDSNTRITAVSPPQAAGRIDIRITTPYGTSEIRTADRFTYN